MDDYVITTADVRERFTDWYNGPKAPSLHEAQSEFDYWLNEIKASAWAEGFDAGEKDVWQHEHSEDGWDADCIKNPYLQAESEVNKISELVDFDDLENLKRQLSYTFLDAYGNFDGADILFNLIVEATETRIIKLLEDQHISECCFQPNCCLQPDDLTTLIKGEAK